MTTDGATAAIEAVRPRSGDEDRWIAAELRREVGRSHLPLPGGGGTLGRMNALASVAGRDLSVGRLYEGHTDALAILAEAGCTARPNAVYGVWAARSPHDPTTATRTSTGWQVSGSKEFCSGVGIIDRALLTAEAPDGYRLLDVDLDASGVLAVDGSWPAVGMAGSASLTVTFDSVTVANEDAVGGPGYYTGRPGFWFGAAGVAACWYGGAMSLVQRLLTSLSATSAEHALTELGRAVACVRSMLDSIERVAREIDADPQDATGRARARALELRETVHAGCVAVLAHVANAGGARPLGHDAEQARRVADLYVYLSQHHGAADAAALGRLTLEEGPRWC